MIAIVTLVRVIQCGLNKIYFLSRLFVDHALQALRYIGVSPMLLDGLTFQTHPAIDVINLAVCALFDADQILRHSGKANRRHFIAGLHQHDGSANGKVKQELTHSQIKVRLPQQAEHCVGVHVQRHLRLKAAILWDLRPRLQPAPRRVWREQARLNAVGKALRRIDGGTVEHARHFVLTR